MYPIPPNETLVETKTCRFCSAPFPITDKDLEFYEKVSPVFPLAQGVSEGRGLRAHNPTAIAALNKGQYKIEWDKIRYSIPAPTLCPDCRQQRRLSFRNERKLYKRNCDATGKSIISMHHPYKDIKVYDYDFWWSDSWDPMSYGRDFDFTRSFFDQFKEFMKEVPYINMSRMESENSDYCNQAGNLSNCYLCFNADFSQNSLYSESIQHSRDCMDCSRIKDCELCSYCTDCEGCFGCKQCLFSLDCARSTDLFNCIGCQDCSYCFDCQNISHREFYAHNEFVGEDQYYSLLEAYREKFNPSKKNEDIAFCTNVTHTKRSSFVSDSVDIEDCKYCSNITSSKDSHDIDYFGIGIELAYECPTVGA